MSIIRHQQIVPYSTSSFLTTASVASNTVTFTKGDGSTFPITVNTGSAQSVNTGSLLTTASVASNTITFTKGDGSTFPIIVSTGSGGNFVPSAWTGSNTSQFAGTASYVVNAASSSYPIRVTGSTLYSVGPSLITPAGNGTIGSIFLGDSAAAFGGETSQNSVLIGPGAGVGMNGTIYSNAIGYFAGSYAVNAQYSNYIGYLAGSQTNNSYNNNFIGRLAGGLAYNVHDSQFIGYYAGGEADDASFSIFIGNDAGFSAKNASESIFIGTGTGVWAKNAASSILIGNKVGYDNSDTNGIPSGSLSIGRNNIIIGSYITLPPSASDSINIGGIIFGTGSYNQSPFMAYSGSAGGKIGINTVTPIYNFQVSGTVAFPNLTNSNIADKVVLIDNNGQLFTTASSAFGGGGGGTFNTGSLVTTSSFNAFTASINTFTSSYNTGSFTGSFTGQFNGSITTAATASYSTNFTVAQTLTLDETLIDFAKVNSTIVGSNNLFQQATGSYTSAHGKYTLYKGANARAGEFVTVWNGTTVTYYDNATTDIGNTADITFLSTIVTSQIQINAVAVSSGWTIKMLTTYL